ncbi:heat-inducible transcriptional repressor HrcA [Jonesia quinghaiensis]|uniref:heat-inducible transcriptional repressor HrcA n=1 Tax=Jonesia quinghaiensis TaxID=262806 RepID=UPI0004190840|nr:heat-inducible transcriptional repressor HrcA [Jonesia quinghaiensis]
MQADQRRLEVLRAIVEDYVSTREPVGSKLIAERHGLGVSPATIRNDMAALEDAGLIAQPHTSAGRIPTDLGYRVFVDRLSDVKPLSSAERNAIKTFLDRAVDLDDVVHRAGRLLAQITGQVAVVQYPSLRKSTVRHLELVRLHPSRVLMVVITDTGRVEQRHLDIDPTVTDEALVTLRATLNDTAVGQRQPHVGERLRAAAHLFSGDSFDVYSQLVDLLTATLDEENEDRLVLAGTSNLTRNGVVITQLRPVLEALEEQVVLLKLLSEIADDHGAVTVRIGRETRLDGLRETSVITSHYGSSTESLGALGSIGPTGMDYPGTIAAVRAVARYLSRILSH